MDRGEALLYPNLISLLKKAKENGINNKLITNGMLLAQNDEIKEICNYLDSLTLSIDSTDNEINAELGRGINHYNNIKTILEYVKDKELKLNINTVVSKKNINQLDDLGNFLNKYKINSWRVFQFMPLRETAEKNREQFEISDAEFESKKGVFQKFENIGKVDYRQEKDMEDKIDIKPKSPNLVIIGNIAYDIIDFSKLEEKRPNIIDIGGACVFSSIPASLFHRVGMVGKIGKYRFKIDMSQED